MSTVRAFCFFSVSALAIYGLLATPALSDPLTLSEIHYIYELGTDKSFDFSADATHACGSNLYRASASTDNAIGRKFSLVTIAFSLEKPLLVNTGGCSGSRMLVGWIRLLK